MSDEVDADQDQDQDHLDNEDEDGNYNERRWREEEEEEERLREDEIEALCVSLRRNDPETTEIPFLHLPYGRRLGEALQGNHYVSSMNLSLNNALAVDEVGGTDTDVSTPLAPLLRYMSNSGALLRLQLEVWRLNRNGLTEVVPTIAHHILLAIAENSRIEELILEYRLQAPPDAFALLMRTTQSLKTLVVMLGDFDYLYPPGSRELVAEAFGANRSLEDLEIHGGSSTRTVESVLLQLASHPRMCELKLNCGHNASVTQIRALAYFLTSTTTLERLELLRYVFDKERLECLVEGLHSNQSLAKLSLTYCNFDLEATEVFYSVMHAGVTGSLIRELCFRGSRMFHGTTTGLAAGTMLTVPENIDSGSCIGSALQVLDLNDGSHSCDFAGFCDALAANPARIRLSCLRHDHVDNAGWDALIRCLPELVYLKELEIRYVDQDLSSLDFVDALRQNGSLQHVAISSDQFFAFNAREMHFIGSYCKRNAAIPTLVANPLLDIDIPSDVDKTDLSLFPTLLQRAKKARRTAPNAMLIALLAAGDSIGPPPHWLD